MRGLELAIHPSLDGSASAVGNGRNFRLSRPAFVASVIVHIAGIYTLSRMSWIVEEVELPNPTAEFLWLSEPLRPPPSEAPAALVVEPAQPPIAELRLPEPRPTEPVPQERVSPAESAPTVVVPAVPPPSAAPQAQREPPVDFEAARQRAAQEVVEQRAREGAYLTFSIDDVAPPRAVEEPKPARSIFDLSSGPRGPKVGQVGQARTRFGHRVSELCNALTGGFSLMGFGSFCARGNDEPTGLFPEVRPEIMSLRPDCVETRPLAAALGEQSPFPTVKCRLVPKEELARGRRLD